MCRQWAEVIIVIPIGLIMISIIFVTILMIMIITILNHQVGHRRWAEFNLHLEGHKLITFSRITRLSKRKGSNMIECAAPRLAMVKRLSVSAEHYLLRPQSIEFITHGFPRLEELIVTYQTFGDWIMDSRLHNLCILLLGRGVNVVARDENESEYHFYLATDLSLLTRALSLPFSYPQYGQKDCYVYVYTSERLQHNLPLLVEMVMPNVDQLDPLRARGALPPRIHFATNNVKMSSEMDVELLKKSMMGLTSFNIWRDGDQELTQEEVTAINMVLTMLQQQRGELTSVSMPKVDLTLSITGIHIKLFLFLGGSSGIKVGLEVWRGRGSGERVEEEGGRLLELPGELEEA